MRHGPQVERGISGRPLPRQESLLGQPVSKSFLVRKDGERRDIVCVHTNAAWNDASNLVTVTKLFTSGYFRDEPQSVLHPDGTMDLYAHPIGAVSQSTGGSGGGATGPPGGVTNTWYPNGQLETSSDTTA